jgi:hypothetical protein
LKPKKPLSSFIYFS